MFQFHSLWTHQWQKTSRNLLSTFFLLAFWSMHNTKQRNQEWQGWDRERFPITDATIWHLKRENSLKSPLVFPSNFLLFFWCEVILNIECLANLLWSLAFDHISHCLTGKIQQILYIQIICCLQVQHKEWLQDYSLIATYCQLNNNVRNHFWIGSHIDTETVLISPQTW